MPVILLIAAFLFSVLASPAIADTTLLNTTASAGITFFENEFVDPACKGISQYTIKETDPSGKVIASKTLNGGEKRGDFKSITSLPDGGIQLILHFGSYTSLDPSDTFKGGSFGEAFERFFTDVEVDVRTSEPTATIRPSAVGNHLILECNSFCSRAPHKMAGPVVECLEGTLNRLIMQERPNYNNTTIFQLVQSAMSSIVILMIILHIAYLGYETNFGKGLVKLTSKNLIMEFVKIALVAYFAMGDAWKDFFLYAIKSISYTGMQIVYKAGVGANANVDGCLFSGSAYPPLKGYLAVFDSMDCMFANFIGFGRGKAIPDAAGIAYSYMMIPVIGIGIITVCSAYVVMVFTLGGIIVQMYLTTILELMMLLFISPLTIPFVLFNKTENVYKKWRDKVQGTILPPIGVFVLYAIMMIILSTVFYGNNPESDQLFVPYGSTESFYINFGDTKDDTDAKKGLRQYDQCLQFYVNNLKDSAGSSLTKLENHNIKLRDPDSNTKAECVMKSPDAMVSEIGTSVYYFSLAVSKTQAYMEIINSITSTANGGKCTTNFAPSTLIDQINNACLSVAVNAAEQQSVFNQEPKYVNDNCSGDSIVCLMHKAAGFATVGVPIPGFIVAFNIPLPLRPDLAVQVMIKMIIGIFTILGLMTVLSQVQTVIVAIFGSGTFSVGSGLQQKLLKNTGASAVAGFNKAKGVQKKMFDQSRYK